jgi:hypothetical protein
VIEPRLPALDAYIARVGAVKKNFRRYVVQEEENGYPREVAVIRIIDGKAIDCSSEDYAPTEEEIEKIVAELAKADLPFSVEISHAQVDELLRSGRIATLFAKPEEKMRYGLLLVSETQGVGKTTVGVIARGVIGKHNTSSPSENEIVNQDWTYWMERRLVLINEIYAGHSSVAYNRLKDLITDEPLWIRKKFLAPYEIDNHVHVIACSNSLKALKLDNSDRRWFVPKVTEEKHTKEYWKQFYDWLYREQGFRKFKHWAKKFLETCDPVHTAAEAPVSDAKNEMIRESYSPGMHLIDRVLEWIKHAYEVRGEGLIGDDVRGGLVEMRRVVELARRQEHFIMFDKDGRKAISETRWTSCVKVST